MARRGGRCDIRHSHGSFAKRRRCCDCTTHCDTRTCCSSCRILSSAEICAMLSPRVLGDGEAGCSRNGVAGSGRRVALIQRLTDCMRLSHVARDCGHCEQAQQGRNPIGLMTRRSALVTAVLADDASSRCDRTLRKDDAERAVVSWPAYSRERGAQHCCALRGPRRADTLSRHVVPPLEASSRLSKPARPCSELAPMGLLDCQLSTTLRKPL